MEAATGLDLWLLGLLLLALLLAANEVGFRLGRRRTAHLPADAGGHVGVLTTGMLGLLAFTLGLAISIADQRFEARRDLVVREANAIGTAWLRAGLLRDAAEAAALRRHLADYARIRLDYTTARPDRDRIAALNRATEAAQARIWTMAEAAARQDATPLTAALVAALNETFDAAQAQRYAHESRVPAHIQWLLLAGSLLAVGAVGYQLGFGPQRHGVLSTLLMAMWTGGMLLVADLNRPREGHILVDPKPLRWALESMDTAAGAGRR
ncbi:hypothetical protein CKO45_11650 [Paracraurococcus ruber]|uniref:DUF4239 domain-containing protein n=2 Tax=Paracraurococcus ruber TaxID=77675 RepID=A0ABS1CWQ3_9PROT|nr:hypothetical protein [Paracraurococcus ruber]